MTISLGPLNGDIDARIENHGSIVLVRPLSDSARDWLRDNIGEAQYFGPALVVELRYVAPLVKGMIADGLVIA